MARIRTTNVRCFGHQAQSDLELVDVTALVLMAATLLGLWPLNSTANPPVVGDKDYIKRTRTQFRRCELIVRIHDDPADPIQLQATLLHKGRTCSGKQLSPNSVNDTHDCLAKITCASMMGYVQASSQAMRKSLQLHICQCCTTWLYFPYLSSLSPGLRNPTVSIQDP